MDGGFERVTPLADARATLRDCVAAHGRTAEHPVSDGSGAVLAAAVGARRDVPHYDRAAMDGYAVRAADTFDASERSPARLEATGDPVEAGTVHPVDTGRPIPDGADAVVRIEAVEERESDLAVFEAVAVGENVTAAGEDVERGEELFAPGHRLRPSDLGLLRASGVETVTVVESPRVAVIPTGDELVDPDAGTALDPDAGIALDPDAGIVLDPDAGTALDPDAGTALDPGETVETNGLLVSALAEQWGGRPTSRDAVPDDADALQDAIERDTDHDLVVTMGGSSVGEHDLVADAVAEVGELLVHGVAIEPGRPVGFGRVDGTPVLVLPGYPVSCLVTTVQFLRPAMAWTTGAEPPGLPSRQARLTGKLPSAPGERTFARVRFVDGEGTGERTSDESSSTNTSDEPSRTNTSDESSPTNASEGAGDRPAVEPVRVGGAGVTSSVARADGWVEIPESREGIPADETVSVEEWERPF